MINATIPKLLAKENIDVVYGNFETAFFDVEKRKLGMPLRADNDNDVESLFYLHEVGHALHTPAEGWHESVIELDIPRDILNIVEDARIEKLVLRDYPGAITSFKRGYRKIVDKKFFGEINDEIVASMNLIDRLNIKCKLRDIINVDFSAEELTFYQRALTLETWEDVLMLSQDLVDFIKGQRDTSEAHTQDEEQDGEMPSEGEGTDAESADQFDPNAWEQEAKEAIEQGDFDEIDRLLKEISQKPDSEEVEKEGQLPEPSNDMISHTDREFKANERRVNNELRDQGIIASSSLKRRDLNKIVIPYSKLSESRPQPSTVKVLSYMEQLQEDAYYDYMKKVKKNVQYAVKEFELRKNAFQQTRAMVRDTGTLDVNKVHSYKYNDNIFAQMTRLGKFQNHGVVMLVDWSGSMYDCLESVIDQLIHMAVFCKKVNVPFEVYSFTNGEWKDFESDAAVIFNQLTLCELLSSNMSKASFEEAAYYLFLQRNRNYRGHFTGPYDGFGSTPLKEALLASDHIITRFKERTKVDKINFVCLTDGDANPLNVSNGRSFNDRVQMNHEGTILEFENTYRHSMTQDTTIILDMIKSKHNTTNIGFFVAGSKRDVHYRVAHAQTPNDYSAVMNSMELNRSEVQKKLKADNCVELTNVIGYDNFFVTLDSQLSIDDDEDYTPVSTEKRDVMKSFRKARSTKKLNKVLMGKIGKAFA